MELLSCGDILDAMTGKACALGRPVLGDLQVVWGDFQVAQRNHLFPRSDSALDPIFSSTQGIPHFQQHCLAHSNCFNSHPM